MTILSAYHTPPTLTLQVRARQILDGTPDSYSTGYLSTALTDPCAWYGVRDGADAGEDLLRGLYLLAIVWFDEGDITEWYIDTSGRLVFTLARAGHTLGWEIDWDHADTLLTPDYLGLDPATTGTTVWGDGQTVNPYALPYLWTPGQAAAIDDEEEAAQDDTEQTTRGYLDPILHREYTTIEIRYDKVGVARVLGSDIATPPGDWSAFERFARSLRPTILPWIYLPDASAQTVLTVAGEALDVERWGQYQVDRVHIRRPLGDSQRVEDTPEKWDVVIKGETYAG